MRLCALSAIIMPFQHGFLSPQLTLRVWFAAQGCNQSCGAGSNFTAEQGWQGMQTLLRDVGYDEATNELLFYPAAETELLRGELVGVADLGVM